MSGGPKFHATGEDNAGLQGQNRHTCFSCCGIRGGKFGKVYTSLLHQRHAISKSSYGEIQASRDQLPPAQQGQFAHPLRCCLPQSNKSPREVEAAANLRP